MARTLGSNLRIASFSEWNYFFLVSNLRHASFLGCSGFIRRAGRPSGNGATLPRHPGPRTLSGLALLGLSDVNAGAIARQVVAGAYIPRQEFGQSQRMPEPKLSTVQTAFATY